MCSVFCARFGECVDAISCVDTQQRDFSGCRGLGATDHTDLRAMPKCGNDGAHNIIVQITIYVSISF